MKTDHLFYRLFQALPTLALELAGIETPGAERYAFHAEEVKQTAFRLDGLLLPLAELREAPVVFVEVQYQPDEEFYGRLFAESGDVSVSLSGYAASVLAGGGGISGAGGGTARRTV